MSHSPLDWVGVFSPDRQQRLLAGVASRHRRTGYELAKLRRRLAEQERRDAEQLELHRHETVGHCREQRREMLQRWDEAEEELTVAYETQTVATRDSLTEVAAKLRQELQDERANIQRKVAARCDAVQHQFENRRNLPGQQMRKEHAQIAEALVPIEEQLEWTRMLTIRRLDQLPSAEASPGDRSGPPAYDVAEPTPTSVKDAVEAIERLTRKAKAINTELQTGAASKTVDSFYLPAGVAVFIVIWVVIVLAIQPEQTLLWMFVSIPIGGLIGFSIYGILLMPLRKMTRQIYPHSEALLAEAKRCAEAGRRVAKKQADEVTAELLQRRKDHLAAAERWRKERLAELEQRITAAHAKAKSEIERRLTKIAETFSTQFNQVGARMRGDADTLADSINQTLTREDVENRERRERWMRLHAIELKRLESRLRSGLIRGLQRIDLAYDRIVERFPSWARVVAAPLPTTDALPCLPVGFLRIDRSLEEILTQTAQPISPDGEMSTHDESPPDQFLTAHVQGEQIADEVLAALPELMPVVLHRRLHAGLVIEAAPNQFEHATRLAQAILWRAVAAVAPGRIKLTWVDTTAPQHQDDPALSDLLKIGGDHGGVAERMLTNDERPIEQRLQELSDQVSRTISEKLHDRFERIEEFNEDAGTHAEPYRVLVAIGFPRQLTRPAYQSLQRWIDAAPRCGTWTILVCDSSQTWPTDMPQPDGRRLLKMAIDETGRWHHHNTGINDLPFVPIDPPPETIRPELIRKLAEQTTQLGKKNS